MRVKRKAHTTSRTSRQFGLKLSVIENGKEGKSKVIASSGFLEKELQQCCKKE